MSNRSLSEKETVILELLLQGRELYGLQLVESSSGLLKRGTVYVTLARMEQKGLVSSRTAERPPGVSGLPRPLYRATGVGRQVLAASRRIAALLVGKESP